MGQMKTLVNKEDSGKKEKVSYTISGEKEKKMALANTPLTLDQRLQILQRTPSRYVYQRPGPKGELLDYVPGGYMKKALNYTFGWLWSTKVVNSGDVKVGDKIVEIWVDVELTIRQFNKKTNEVTNIITKTQTGGSVVKYLKSNPKKPVSYANNRKAAITDAVKKCASELGIASDVYNKNEYNEIQRRDTEEPTRPIRPSKPLKDQLIGLLKAKGAKDDKEMKVLLEKQTGISVSSINRISEKRAEMAINYLFTKAK